LSGHGEVVELLIKRGANVNALTIGGLAAGSTPLHCAASKGHVTVANILIDHGALLDEKNLQGQTPLHCATAQKRPDMATLLVNRGSNVNVVNGGNLLPLHYAASEGLLDIVKLLVAKGSDLDKKGAPSPAALAGIYKHEDVVNFLKAHKNNK